MNRKNHNIFRPNSWFVDDDDKDTLTIFTSMYPSIHPNKMFLLNFSLFSVSNVIDTGEIGLTVKILFFGTIKYSLWIMNITEFKEQCWHISICTFTNNECISVVFTTELNLLLVTKTNTLVLVFNCRCSPEITDCRHNISMPNIQISCARCNQGEVITLANTVISVHRSLTPLHFCLSPSLDTIYVSVLWWSCRATTCAAV